MSPLTVKLILRKCEFITAAGSGSSDVIRLYFIRLINKYVCYLCILCVCMLQFQGWFRPLTAQFFIHSQWFRKTASYHLLRCVRKAIFLTDEGCVLAKEQECITFNETSHAVSGSPTSLGRHDCVDRSKHFGSM